MLESVEYLKFRSSIKSTLQLWTSSAKPNPFFCGQPDFGPNFQVQTGRELEKFAVFDGFLGANRTLNSNIEWILINKCTFFFSIMAYVPTLEHKKSLSM